MESKIEHNILIAFLTSLLFFGVNAIGRTAFQCEAPHSLLLTTMIFLIFIFVINLAFRELIPSATRMSIGQVVRFTILTTLLYYFLSSKEVFGFMNYIPNIDFLDASGCPSWVGITFHSFLFLILNFMFMYLS